MSSLIKFGRSCALECYCDKWVLFFFSVSTIAHIHTNIRGGVKPKIYLTGIFHALKSKNMQ